MFAPFADCEFEESFGHKFSLQTDTKKKRAMRNLQLFRSLGVTAKKILGECTCSLYFYCIHDIKGKQNPQKTGAVWALKGREERRRGREENRANVVEVN